ncbi:MAG: hypothetical protein ACKO2L_02605 [Planctomycetaceae bacterium]
MRRFICVIALGSLLSPVMGQDAWQGCDQPVNCARPKREPKRPEAAPAPTPEGTFVTGPTSGDVAGESSSLGIRFGTLRIPEIAIPLPTIQLPSFVRYRRDAEMHTEAARAPFVYGPVTEFGLQPRGVAETAGGDESPSGSPETQETDEPYRPCQPCRPCPPHQCVPPCSEEGCARMFGNEFDSWQASLRSAPAPQDDHVARLEAQMSALQKSVEKLAIAQGAAANPTAVNTTAELRSQSAARQFSVDRAPTGSVRQAGNVAIADERVAEASVRDELIRRQAEQISRLEAELKSLRHTDSNSTVPPRSATGKAVLAERKASNTESSKPLARGFSSLVDRLKPSRK